MDKTDLLNIVRRITANAHRLCCLKQGMNGRLFQIAYTLADEKLPRFEHFDSPEQFLFVWKTLESELAGGMLPTCVKFDDRSLVATRQVTRLRPTTVNGVYYVHFEFTGGHSLSFGYTDIDACANHLARAQFFLGLTGNEEVPLLT